MRWLLYAAATVAATAVIMLFLPPNPGWLLLVPAVLPLSYRTLVENA